MHRKGLTLVEMLVALALTIFLMAILSEAFVTGLKAFRRLKAVGDLDQQLRTVSSIVRRDLQADHFEGGRRLSTYRLNTRRSDGLYDRPELGYFYIREGHSGGMTSVLEGVDSQNRPSLRDAADPANPAANPGDLLAFTARLSGNRPENFFFGAVPLRRATNPPLNPIHLPLDNWGYPPGRFDAESNGVFSSQWAEIAYFIEPDLRPDGSVRTAYDETTNTTLPLFKLYRVQLLLVPDAATLPIFQDPRSAVHTLEPPEGHAAWDDGSLITVIEDAVRWQNYYAGNVGQGMPQEYRHDVSATPEQQPNNRWRYRYNSPADVQFPGKRFFADPLNWRARRIARAGADLLAVNVLSWDVKVYDPVALVAGPTGSFRPEFVDLGQPPLIPPPNLWAWNGPTSPAPVALRSQFLNPVYEFDTLGNRRDPASGDLSATAAPHNGPLQAIQIRIRLWDEKTRQTREITIVQDL
jgi:type II secretory pathway pseudopilin PulG